MNVQGYEVMRNFLGNVVLIREDGKECILPPWVGGYALAGEWSVLEAILAARKLTITDSVTGKRLGWLGGRYWEDGEPIEGADDPTPDELVFTERCLWA